LGLIQDFAVLVLPNTEEKKGKSVARTQSLALRGIFGLGLPAKKLRGYEKGQDGPECKSKDLREQLPDSERRVHGSLQSANEIGGREEDGNALRDFGQVGDGQGRAREKNQRKPEELVQDLGFLHGVW